MGRRASLMRKPPKYVHGYIDCRGRPRWYLRRPGFKRVPLPGLPWSPEFMAAYEAAMSGEKIQPGKSRIKPGSVADLITLYYQTAAFLQLADATRQTYRGILERFRPGMATALWLSWKSSTFWRSWIRKQPRQRRQTICAACYGRS